jgi:transcriptional regulator NrdR family protein
MKCPVCQGPTRVTDCRSLAYDLAGIPKVIYWPLRMCVHLVDYFKDFKARQRRCQKCGHLAVTVELNLEEVDKMLDKQSKVVYRVPPKGIKESERR